MALLVSKLKNLSFSLDSQVINFNYNYISYIILAMRFPHLFHKEKEFLLIK